jgi:hypothetical protein
MHPHKTTLHAQHSQRTKSPGNGACKVICSPVLVSAQEDTLQARRNDSDTRTGSRRNTSDTSTVRVMETSILFEDDQHSYWTQEQLRPCCWHKTHRHKTQEHHDHHCKCCCSFCNTTEPNCCLHAQLASTTASAVCPQHTGRYASQTWPHLKHINLKKSTNPAC